MELQSIKFTERNPSLFVLYVYLPHFDLLCDEQLERSNALDLHKRLKKYCRKAIYLTSFHSHVFSCDNKQKRDQTIAYLWQNVRIICAVAAFDLFVTHFCGRMYKMYTYSSQTISLRKICSRRFEYVMYF